MALVVVAVDVAVVVALLVVAVAAFVACCVYSKILNKLLPHLQLRKSMQNTKIHKQAQAASTFQVPWPDRDIYTIHSPYIIYT